MFCSLLPICHKIRVLYCWLLCQPHQYAYRSAEYYRYVINSCKLYCRILALHRNYVYCTAEYYLLVMNTCTAEYYITLITQSIHVMYCRILAQRHQFLYCTAEYYLYVINSCTGADNRTSDHTWENMIWEVRTCIPTLYKTLKYFGWEASRIAKSHLWPKTSLNRQMGNILSEFFPPPSPLLEKDEGLQWLQIKDKIRLG